VAVSTETRRRRIRILSFLYLAAAVLDFAYHLSVAMGVGDQRITWNDLAVAFEASLFWPVDVVVRVLSAN
jgi:hypothetical protein